ncbi:hypothetical protein SKAU_G00336170 [Synaphobranchus kaupii]|uniref:Uncharacterized protein n=1 Tax=Synaphobranchus kaupii TaxID=118154 RepID=A0A9Q1IIZ5_SYNKA|nr:hypothetical protein SKAU_G00336170 [Synaphobranchus kaupii]
MKCAVRSPQLIGCTAEQKAAETAFLRRVIKSVDGALVTGGTLHALSLCSAHAGESGHSWDPRRTPSAQVRLGGPPGRRAQTVASVFFRAFGPNRPAHSSLRQQNRGLLPESRITELLSGTGPLSHLQWASFSTQ